MWRESLNKLDDEPRINSRNTDAALQHLLKAHQKNDHQTSRDNRTTVLNGHLANTTPARSAIVIHYSWTSIPILKGKALVSHNRVLHLRLQPDKMCVIIILRVHFCYFVRHINLISNHRYDLCMSAYTVRSQPPKILAMWQHCNICIQLNTQIMQIKPKSALIDSPLFFWEQAI